jgi:alpha-beta hydrolase superfamily lysophospholipase
LQKETQARILIYRHSNIAPTAEYLAQRTLYRQSEHLVECLVDVRQGDMKRPLIFVAHSLGGIIVKSGLIFSSQNMEEGSPTQSVALSTAGIIFLGTPHRLNAHPSSSSGSILRRISESIGLNPRVLKHLDDESNNLQISLEHFETLSADFPVASFYESHATKHFGIVC